MREIQTATDREAEAANTMAKRQPVDANAIRTLHYQATTWSASAVTEAARACHAAIECGVLLLQAKEENSGEFLLWLETNCPGIDRRTAARYMRVGAKYGTALSQGSLDFQTLKDLYIATGIMPEPEADHTESTAPQLPVWAKLTTKLDAIIEKLKGEDRERLRQWCQLVLQRL